MFFRYRFTKNTKDIPILGICVNFGTTKKRAGKLSRSYKKESITCFKSIESRINENNLQLNGCTLRQNDHSILPR